PSARYRERQGKKTGAFRWNAPAAAQPNAAAGIDLTADRLPAPAASAPSAPASGASGAAPARSSAESSSAARDGASRAPSETAAARIGSSIRRRPAAAC